MVFDSIAQPGNNPANTRRVTGRTARLRGLG